MGWSMLHEGETYLALCTGVFTLTESDVSKMQTHLRAENISFVSDALAAEELIQINELRAQEPEEYVPLCVGGAGTDFIEIASKVFISISSFNYLQFLTGAIVGGAAYDLLKSLVSKIHSSQQQRAAKGNLPVSTEIHIEANQHNPFQNDFKTMKVDVHSNMTEDQIFHLLETTLNSFQFSNPSCKTDPSTRPPSEGDQ